MLRKSDQLPKALVLALLLFITGSVLAQNRVTGKITYQSDNQPVAGATIREKGTPNTTVSESTGSFSITVRSNATLLITFVGYASQEIKVNDRSNISVVLQPEVGNLNEVVVVGYGTQKRANVTSAISSLDGKTLNEVPASNLSQAFQGRLAGVTVVNNGTPGSQPIVRIRGISSISFSSDPLYVIDGIPTGDISSFDMRDVESVDVLKDASASAIYGSRATNGVVVITTKRGKKDGRLHVNFNSYYGVQKVTKRLDLLDREGFMKYALAYRGSQVPRLLPPEVDKPIYAGATQTYGQTNTDWQDAYFRNGPMSQVNIDVSGGNETSRFSLSGGYTNQQGTAPNVAFNRYNFKLSSDHNLSKVFTLGETIFTSFSTQYGDANSGGTRSNLVNVIRMMPHMPVYDPTSNGGYRGVNATLDGGDPTNPIEDAELKNPTKITTTKLLANMYLDINFAPWLKLKSSFGIDYANRLNYRFQPIFNDNGTINGSSATQASITNNRSISTVLLFTEQLTFDKRYGSHHVTATGVFETQQQQIKNENGYGNQPSNDIRVLNNALNQSVSTTMGENFLVSLLGRVNYDFEGKYMLSASIRRDGLSVWAPGKKWGNFPSASVGWKIDQENFMKKQQFFSALKLRGGYGITGINGVLLGNTPWLVNVDANSSSYPYNNLNPGGLGSAINQLGNQDLEWETTKQYNIGVDLAILHNKITFTADYFNRRTDNLILGVTVPPSFGYVNNTVIKNVGSMQNTGWEFVLGYNGQAGDFKWNVSANASFIQNKVLSLAEGLTNIEAGADAADFGGWAVTNTKPGESIQYYYGFIVDGIFQTTAEVASSPVQVKGTTAPGDLKFRDISGPGGKPDGVIDAYDRTNLGSYLPKISYGINIAADYKNFDLAIFLQGVQGNMIYNDTRVITEGMIRFFNAGTQVLNAWTPTNTNTTIPRAVSNDPNGNGRTSTRFLEDGSYLRLKNITLGYNLASAKLTAWTKGTVRSFRFYISGQNLLTATKYTGYDPEVGNRTNNSLTNGIDWAIYPQPKAFQVGVQVNFQ